MWGMTAWEQAALMIVLWGVVQLALLHLGTVAFVMAQPIFAVAGCGAHSCFSSGC